MPAYLYCSLDARLIVLKVSKTMPRATYFQHIKPHIMKARLITVIALIFAIGCDMFDTPEVRYCTKPDYPYWCAVAKTCCSLPYTDGQYCYSTETDCAKSGKSCELCKIEAGSSKTGGKYDGSYSGNFISSTPCGFKPCATSSGQIAFSVVSGKVTNGGALQGTIDSNGIFTGTWSTGVSSPFKMELHSSTPSFSSSSIKLVGPTQAGADESGNGAIGATVTVKKN